MLVLYFLKTRLLLMLSIQQTGQFLVYLYYALVREVSNTVIFVKHHSHHIQMVTNLETGLALCAVKFSFQANLREPLKQFSSLILAPEVIHSFLWFVQILLERQPDIRCMCFLLLCPFCSQNYPTRKTQVD